MNFFKKQKKVSKKVIGIIVSAMVVSSVVGFSTIMANKNSVPEGPAVSRERQYQVTRGDITAGTTGGGSLRFEMVNHNFSEPVVIGELFVKEGQSVKVGDKLASISDEFIEEKLKELNTKLEQANSSLEQAKNSKQSTVLSENKSWNDKTQQSQSQFESQKGELSGVVKVLNEKINDIKNRIADSVRQIEELEAKNEENRRLIEELSVNSEENAVTISELNAQIEQNGVQIEQLRQTESSLYGELGGVEEELRVANDRLNILEGDRKKEIERENAEKASNKEINSLAHSNLDNAIESAQREVDQIKEDIQKVNVLKEETILYAQVDGVVLSLGYQEGGTTTVDMPVVGIGESDKVLAEIVISQNDITKILENQNVYLEVSAFQDEKFTGFVKSINLKPEAQGNTTNYKVTVEVDKKDFKLLDGMTVSAQFILKDVQDVLMLSNKAITLKDGKQVVNVKNEDGTVTETEITTGFSDGKNSEIISGLSEGDTVIVGG